MTIPAGTFDALRLSVIQESKDSTWAQVGSNWLLISTTNSTTNFYDWYTNAPGVDLLLVSLAYDQTWTNLESANFFMGSFVGMKEPADHISINIYPNPSKDEIFLKMKDMEKARLQISDMSGKAVFDEAITGGLSKINVEALPAGTYICRIIDGDDHVVFRQKIILNR